MVNVLTLGARNTMEGTVMRVFLIAGFVALWPLASSASPADKAVPLAPVDAQSASNSQVQVFQRTQLRSGTAIVLETLEAVTTDSGKWEEGEVFSLRVAEPVYLGQYLVIPQGTKAYGTVVSVTRPGAFGKSGKIEVSLDYLVLGGKKVPLAGSHRAEGKGTLNSPATIIAAGPFAPFIDGDGADIGRGALLKSYLAEDLGVVVPYKAPVGRGYGSAETVVRARQISVAEAFRQRSPSSKPDKVIADPARVTVAEAFKAELRSLDKQP